MKTETNPNSSWLEHEGMQRKIYAFVVMACTTFIMGSLLWPLSVSSFRSSTSIPVAVGTSEIDNQNMQNALAMAAERCKQDDFLSELIARVKAENELVSPKLADYNLTAIRQAMHVSAMTTDSPNAIQLDFAYDGNGTKDEQAFVGLLAKEFSEQVVSGTNADAANSIALRDASLRELEGLGELVSKVETEVATMKESLNTIQLDNGSPFRTASHTSSKSAPDLDTLQQSLNSIDTNQIQDRCDELRQIVSQPGIGAGGVPNASSNLKTVPVGGTPTVPGLILVGLFSAFVGSVVAMNYEPFANRGFESVGKVASALRVPVVAVLPMRAQDGNEPGVPLEENTIPWANRAVSFARFLLLALLVITIGFCLVNGNVREAFFRNPFHGFSQMVWVFVGH